ncbi:MAG: hypothetical protein O7B81_08460 [Gammaproteobacteria bacterium]|nr:hypothetical protein [Gammaproteobacteria bacterium]
MVAPQTALSIPGFALEPGAGGHVAPAENRVVYEMVSALAAERFLGPGAGVARGALEVNDWSFCIGLTAWNGDTW